MGGGGKIKEPYNLFSGTVLMLLRYLCQPKNEYHDLQNLKKKKHLESGMGSSLHQNLKRKCKTDQKELQSDHDLTVKGPSDSAIH